MPFSYIAASVSTFPAFVLSPTGLGESWVLLGSASVALCWIIIAADAARAIFSSRWVWRTMSWIIL